MQQVGDSVMSLNRPASIDIHRNTNCLTRLRRPSLREDRAMNENVSALLRICNAELANLRAVVSWNVKQSMIANLSAHLRIQRRPIENYIDFVRFFAGQNGLNHSLCLEKIVTEKFRRRGFQFTFFDTDCFLFLRFPCAFALLAH